VDLWTGEDLGVEVILRGRLDLGDLGVQDLLP
jgi:hypothetical protein